jgi:predicted MFS family arabinose efflux permease
VGIPRRLVFILAAACGLAVANLYYAQPLLATIAREFHSGTEPAGLVVTLTQIGYALGLAFLVPLGDMLERRRLAVTILCVAAVALIGAALAPSLLVLALLGLAIGGASVVVQILVPLAADLAAPSERGRVVGTVMSGLLIGILLARTLSGLVAGATGWRWVYVLAAVLMVGLAVVLRRTLPRTQPTAGLSYPALLRSVLTILRDEAVLRRRALFGALGFATFSAFWTTAAFLLAGPPYRYSTSVIGLFGLLGVAGALMASLAGRLADRGHAHGATGGFAAAILASFGLIFLGGHALAALIAGIVLLDLGVQGLQITNQSQVYSLRPDARSRINTAYMTSYFVGGALGSAGAVLVYGLAGWGGVCLFGAACAAAILALWLATDTRRGA